MATMTCEPDLLPTADTEPRLSGDVPSESGVRPFGMTNIETVPADSVPEITGLVYDPVQQISVTDDGAAAGQNDRLLRAGTKEDTRHDNQWFTDND